ncbi:MAG: insulinase family protein [Nanoarchaeota archaeon]|nr:insulinase family protein [Nanoarchaeota archaeon]MBU1027966.1 insulinase family protein [Nanoarchaeota archaeon]
MKPTFYRKVLKNGMTIVFEKRDLPVVNVAFAVRNGGVNEAGFEKGISHFIEHMLYKGTPTRNAKQIAEEIERKGGVLNGFTSETVTAYWCKMPSKHVNVALNVLSDIVKNPKFDEKELEKERKVIFEEMKMYKDDPKRYVLDEIQSYLYGEPLGLNLIGTEKTMGSISRDKMIKKFEEVYQPNNIILCVVGDTNFDKIVDFAEKNFNNKKGKVSEFKINLKNKTKIEFRTGIDQANLIFAYHVPVSRDKKNYAAQVLSCLMAEGMSSRLFSEIREKRNLAYAVKGYSDINSLYAYNAIYVGTTKSAVEEVKKIILQEFGKIKEDLNEKELEQVKDQLIGNYQISMEDSQRQMVGLLLSEIDGDAKEFYEYEKNIQKVQLSDVKKIAEKVKNAYSFFALVPK